ncbi:MAG: ABC transporter substrate-binding protein [Eggerthellaceae bacterium]|nr:ABC transporter substrate-binding protein [Eggerthellaceae bacterium]
MPSDNTSHAINPDTGSGHAYGMGGTNANASGESLFMRRIAAIICMLLAFSLVLFAACSPSRPANPRTGNVITDCAGRHVEVPENAQSVACLYAYTGHVCVLLGCEDKISAVVKGLKRDHLMERKIENIDDLPSPYGQGAINIEELSAVKPDLILVRSSVLQDAGELEKLGGLGIPYLIVDYTTAADQIYSIEMMGSALGSDDRAKAYTDYYRSTFDLVRERVASIPASEKLTVFHSVNEAVRTDIPGTLSYEVLENAGCVNVVSKSSELHLDGEKGNATVEQIYTWDPDVVLVNEPTACEYIKTDSKFSGLRAVREGRVFQLPVGISRWAHPGSVESPIATLYIAKLLYPDRFEDIDISQETKDFYERFFDISLTDEDVESILSGIGMREAREGSSVS